MIFETLGNLDLITVLILMGAAILPSKLLLFAGVYLIIKGLLFVLLSRDFASHLDLGCGVYLVVLSYGLYIPILHQLVLLWLLQKTIMTFIAIGIHLMLFYHTHREDFPFASRD